MIAKKHLDNLHLLGLLLMLGEEGLIELEIEKEKEVKKDFEIISIQLFDNTILTYDSQGNCIKRSDTYPVKGTRSLKDTFEHKKMEFKIHSVKRLFDNEVFTIGDKITGKSSYCTTINNIELNPNCHQIMFNRLDEGIDLINAKKVKQPILVTKDGVKLFINNDVYLVDPFFTLGSMLIKDNFKIFNHFKYFSTKKAAQDYILLNKACLSFSDIIELGRNTTGPSNTFDIDELELLIRKKLKL